MLRSGEHRVRRQRRVSQDPRFRAPARPASRRGCARSSRPWWPSPRRSSGRRAARARRFRRRGRGGAGRSARAPCAWPSGPSPRRSRAAVVRRPEPWRRAAPRQRSRRRRHGGRRHRRRGEHRRIFARRAASYLARVLRRARRRRTGMRSRARAQGAPSRDSSLRNHELFARDPGALPPAPALRRAERGRVPAR